MKTIYSYKTAPALLFCLLLFQACEIRERKTVAKISNYERFRDSVLEKNRFLAPDTSNILDDTSFRTKADTGTSLLVAIDTLMHQESSLMERMDSLMGQLKNMGNYSPEEKADLRENIRMLDSFLMANKSEEATACREKECYLYAEVIKSAQMLYLHLDGVLKDSFPVSTGMGKYATPDLNTRPAGPVLKKYTSRKWPDGDYKGLGNMPYAVFVKGGYAIHGTTPGNFSKLGTVASHGCIRLHPDNARVFYELVKLIGLSDTWVNIRDSL